MIIIRRERPKTELREGALAERGGVVKYLPEFDRV